MHAACLRNRACHSGGHLRDYYSGALSCNSLLIWRLGMHRWRVYRCPIFRWVLETWLYDRENLFMLWNLTEHCTSYHLVYGIIDLVQYWNRLWLACMMAPSNYLSLCWFGISEVLWHSPESNFTGNAFDIVMKFVWKRYNWYYFNFNFNFKSICMTYITAAPPNSQRLNLIEGWTKWQPFCWWHFSNWKIFVFWFKFH